MTVNRGLSLKVHVGDMPFNAYNPKHFRPNQLISQGYRMCFWKCLIGTRLLSMGC